MLNKKEWTDKDSLEDFLHWFLISGPSIGRVPFNNPITYTKFGDKTTTSITWYRSGPFQVQLIIIEPDTIIPEHKHPNMDSFEVYSGGKINFYLNGKLETEDWKLLDIKGDEVAPNRGNFIRVRPDSMHGGIFGPGGSIFFSVQKWLNGVSPKDVTQDWDGIVYSEEHKNTVSTGTTMLVDTHSTEDAYSSNFLN